MIVGILGNLGRGKTITMTFLIAYFMSKSSINNVVTNYRTDFTTHYVENEKQLDEMSQQTDFTAIYGLDEVWAWINARSVMENFDMIEFVLNSRKRGAFIIYTTQKQRQVDPILVENTDYLVVPMHLESVETDYDHDVVEVYFLRSENYDIVNKITFNAEAYYGSYDTDEEISSISDAEKFKDLIQNYKERVENNEFEYKKELVSHLQLHEDMSLSQSERITDEIFRTLKIEDQVEDHSDEDEDEDENNKNSGQQKLV